MNPISRNVWARFVKVSLPLLRSDQRWRALRLLAVLIALLFLLTGLNIANSYVNRYFMSALAERQVERFYLLALVYVGVFAASTVGDVFYGYAEGRLGLFWRKWLTMYFVERYLSDHAYFHVNNRPDVDNPDQRISEDIKSFTTTTLSFVLMVLNSTINGLAFLGILWSITPWLFVVAITYTVLGSVLTVLVGHRLVELNNRQLHREANLRYELVHVRDQAESVALLAGEAKAKSRLRLRLDAVVDNFLAIITLSRNLGFLTTGYNYLIQLVPLVITAPLYLSGKVEFGVVTQAGMAFAQVVGAFSIIVVQFQNLSTFAAVIRRLGSLHEAIDEATAPGRVGIERVEDGARVAYERLTLWTPRKDRVLVRNLSLEVSRGKRLLVMGPNGIGKSAMFRATAGVWEAGEGKVFLPPREQLMFVPQRPYQLPGTLRDQLLYGYAERPVSDERLLGILRKVKLDELVRHIGGLDVERDWPNTLSLGEQQQLAFARLLLRSPRFAFLDEAVKALVPELGQSLYQAIAQTSITYISMANRPDLLAYHDRCLELQPDGGWKVVPAERAASGG